MRRSVSSFARAGAAAWALTTALTTLALVVAGCDTKGPPESGTARTLQLSMFATGALVQVYNVWDAFEDGECDDLQGAPLNPRVACNSDAICQGIMESGGNCLQDQQPDDVNRNNTTEDEVTLWCEPFVGTVNNPGQIQAASVPWRFNTEIRLIRAGETESRLLTPASAASGSNNTTPSDESNPGSAPAKPPVFNIVWANPRQLTAASRELLESGRNNANQVGCPAVQASDLPAEGIAGRPWPFTVTVNKGDTLIVKARKDHEMNEVPVLSEPTLAAVLTLDGQIVQPIGPVESATGDPKGFVSFSFTVR